MKTQILIILFIGITLLQTSCASRKREVVTAGVVGAAAGAGLGYTVVHHGPNRKHVLPNTIITSALTGLIVAGAAAYHYRQLDRQKIEITSKFGRSYLLDPLEEERRFDRDNFPSQVFVPQQEHLSRESIQLDDSTRWVVPTFRKRYLRPETGEDEFLSSRYTWEIVRPGFFVTPERDPEHFDGRRSKPSKGDIHDK